MGLTTLRQSVADWSRRQQHRLAFSMRRADDSIWDIDDNELVERIRAAIKDEKGHVYLCIENFLPEKLYKACVSHWPLAEQRAHSRTRIVLDWLDKAPVPDDVRKFWARFGHEVINGKVKSALVRAFLPYLERKFDFLPKEEVEWARTHMKIANNLNEGLNLDAGFGIGPHVDQYYIFVTSLLYMPPDRTQPHMGTMLFRPKSPELRTLNTTFVPVDEVEEVLQFPFLPNTLCSFLQTPVSFHGLVNRTSEKARRSYQFNVMMDDASLERLYKGQPIN